MAAQVPAQVRLIPCLQDNYGVLVHDPATGATAAIDAPEAAPIEAALKGNGWAGSAALDRDAATDLVKSFDGYKIRLVIQADGESVLAAGSTDYKRVCRS